MDGLNDYFNILFTFHSVQVKPTRPALQKAIMSIYIPLSSSKTQRFFWC